MIHWVDLPAPGRLGIMPRPRGGDWLGDEARRWREAGVDAIVSLLEETEARELELELEADCVAAQAMTFLSLPIPDRQTPGDAAAFRALVMEVAGLLKAGSAVAIHCRAGIGRSSVLAASVLAARGVAVADAFRLLSACRGLDVPDTSEQRAWVERFAAERLQPPR
jgi:protein-tyrosine phosphatase